MADFCLIGKRLNYSYSAVVHTKLGCDYELKEVAPDKLKDFVLSRKYKGYNVTIPYKSAIKEFIDELDESAREIGVVNLVNTENGKLVGYNMDIKGLEYAEKCAGISVKGKKVLILGTGNTSITAEVLMRKLGAGEVIKISREGENNYANIAKHSDAKIIINTTPVGTYPANEEFLVDLSVFPELEGVQEVIYNPFKTRLILQAEARGLKVATGLDMLVGQAAYSDEKFIGKLPDFDLVRKVINEILYNEKNIILVGMPASGKTTIGKALASALDRKFVDTDSEVEKIHRKSIPEIFAKEGERIFRLFEREVIANITSEHRQVIATGGGAVLDEDNRLNLMQNGIIIYLKRDLDALSDEGRPLSQNGNIRNLYNQRAPIYEKLADFTVENIVSVQSVVKKICEILEKTK